MRIPPPQCTTECKKPKRDGFDIANIIILTWAFFAACAAAYEADRLANLTQRLVTDAERATIAGSRAWIGPYMAKVTGSLEKTKGIGILLQYMNTGREPATDLLFSAVPNLVPLAVWTSGKAAENIITYKDSCLKTAPILRGTRVAFPSAGNAAYSMSINTADAQITKITVTEGLLGGQEILVIEGCFVYHSVERIHHTAFCFFYQANVSTLPALNICTVGNDAD